MPEIIANILRGISFILVFGIWIYTLRKYKFLPETIPVHFDFEQKPDRFGSRKFLFLMPVLAVLVSVLFYLAGENPESANYPVEITQENAYLQFSVTTVLMSWLSVIIILIFFNIQDYMIRLSLNAEAKPKVHLLVALILVFISVIASVIITYIYK